MSKFLWNIVSRMLLRYFCNPLQTGKTKHWNEGQFEKFVAFAKWYTTMCWKLIFYGLLHDSVMAPRSSAKSLITGNMCLCAGDLFICTAGRMWSWNCAARLKNSASFVSIGYFVFIATVHRLQRWGPVMCTRLFPVGVYEKCHVWVYCVGDQHTWTITNCSSSWSSNCRAAEVCGVQVISWSSACHRRVTTIQPPKPPGDFLDTLYLFCLLPFIQ